MVKIIKTLITAPSTPVIGPLPADPGVALVLTEVLSTKLMISHILLMKNNNLHTNNCCSMYFKVTFNLSITQ